MIAIPKRPGQVSLYLKAPGKRRKLRAVGTEPEEEFAKEKTELEAAVAKDTVHSSQEV